MTPEHEPATENRFRQEAQEYLNALQDALLDLFEAAGDRARFDRRLDEVLSWGRSLRGVAEKAEWRGIAKLSQRLEENLQRVRWSRPPLGLKFRNRWRQALSALQAAIAVQEDSPFADRIGVEATAAEALDRLEWHLSEAPAGGDPWAELEHCLRLLESLREGWQDVSEAEADLAAVQEALMEVGIAIPEVVALQEWLVEAAASCQDLGQWQKLGEQASQRLQEVLGHPPAEWSVGSSPSLLATLEAPSTAEEPFEFPDFNETELFTSEGSSGTMNPFAWFEPAVEAPADFFEAGTEGEAFNREIEAPGADGLGGWAEFGSEEAGTTEPEPNFWEEDPSLGQEEPGLEGEAGGGELWPKEGGAIAPVGNLFGEESATVAETVLDCEPDFHASSTAELAAEGSGDLSFGEEPATVVEMAPEPEPDFTAATTEEPSPGGEEPATVAEMASEPEPDFTAATTEEPSPEGLGDLAFWQEAGYDAGLAADMESVAEALAGLGSWLETAAPEVGGRPSGVPFSLEHSPNLEVENAEISLDSLLTDLDAALPDMDELAAVSLESLAQSGGEAPSLSAALSDSDFIDLEQALAGGEPAIVSPEEFEALNFDLNDDVRDEPPHLPALDFGNHLSDLAATFDGEPPALPKVRPVSRPVFSGPESVVFAPMETAQTDLTEPSWIAQLLYDVAADLGAGQIVLNWQLQQLRMAVRSLLGHARNLGAPLEAAAETPSANGGLPEELLRLREISEDIDLALFEMEQANADRQRQIWQVQELAREERLCSLGSLGQQLVQGLARSSVQLAVENSTVALDRPFVNKLLVPLGDLFKLLATRSIEEPAERQRLGKPVTGTLRMRGLAVGDTLNLEITDDGAGLPFDIFQPGAPGAAIADRFQALGIALRPDFTTGRGSRVHLSLPYVLLMTRVLLLRIGSAMVAVRTEHVRDLLAIPPTDSRTLIWGHRTIPWMHAQDRIRVNCRRQELPVFESPAQENVLVVLQSGDQAYGLAVQACWHEQEATLQRLAGGMTLSFPFCGFAVLMDGRAIPLLAPGDLLTPSDDGNTQVRLLEKQKRQSARELLTRRSPQLILLVDDSINVRRYLASVLESAGFATVQARDGLEALEKLENGLQPGAIISDLEMPRMDGYTLLQRVRAREVSRHVPFVVLTSRTNERHRQQAEALGATAYINKPYRDEEMVRLMQQLTTPAADR